MGFAGLIALGTMLLMLPISSRRGTATSFETALFTATSATCVTGLVVRDTATHWSVFGQMVILALIQTGGLGIIMAAAGFSLLSGRRISLRERSMMFPSTTRQPTVEYVIKQLQDEHLLAEDTTSILCCADITADDQALQEQVDQSDRLIVLTQFPSRNEALASAIDKAHAADKKVVLISLNLPYEAACYSDADAVLCGYQPYGAAFDAQGNGPVNMNVATVLFTAFGKSVPQGTLPVNVPAYNDADKTFSSTEVLYERGFGIQNWGV